MEETQRENDSNNTSTTQQADQWMEPMDATDPGPGQERPPGQSSPLSPRSGRQRKKNPRFLDYVTDSPSPEEKRPRRTPVRRSSEGQASRKSPAKRGRPKKAVEPKANGDQEPIDQMAHASVGEPSRQTPTKTPAVKKTPARKIPAKERPATEENLSPARSGGIDTEERTKETPKPETKDERGNRGIQEVAAAETPTFCEDKGEPAVEPEDDIVIPGGRPRRGAAKAALKYLRSLAKETLDTNEESGSQSSCRRPNTDLGRGMKGPKAGSRERKRKGPDFDSDNTVEDKDFVPDAENEEDEEMEEAQVSDFDSDSYSDWETTGRSAAASLSRSIGRDCRGRASNGLHNNIMNPVWECAEINKKFREEHCSSWVFPEWVPSINDWHLVPHSDLEKYLPQELQSAAFKVSRDGLSKEDSPLQRLHRFESVAAHPERWDMSLYVGGPVWAIEWCPSPDGATAAQYVALSCHRGMDDLHYANQTYAGSGLIQLWDLGKLEYSSRPESQPVMIYGLAQDRGFVWQLKWCPAGAWELPSCSRKAPFLPRLGLLAAATSTGVVTIYSLPHPDALLSNKELLHSGDPSRLPRIYQAQGVATLKLGSFKAPHHERSGQVLSMDWLPDKPHNIMAIGFYDGVVGLWDLSTKSSLLRLRDPDRSLTLLPYRCFLAHDNAVRALAFCPTSRYLLATAGDDRMMKTWDLKKIYEPIISHKRHLPTEVYWPLRASGLFVSDENTYATHHLHGVHYYDMGYHNIRPVFLIPRTGTMWSMSLTDWLNGLVTSDTLGEVIVALLPRMNNNPQYTKRTIERRFPVYFTDLVPHDTNTTEEEKREAGGPQKEGGEFRAGERVKESDGGRGGEDDGLPQPVQTYSEAANKYFLHYSDNNLVTFKNYQMRAPWKRMQATEVKTKINMDIMPMAALHKVRFNPNMSCHTWVVSGGQAGLVRVHCLRGLHKPNIQKIITKNQAQFNALYSPEDQSEALQTSTHQL